MNVQAISGISSAPKFEGGMKKVENNYSAQGYPQMDAPISKNAAKALESASMVSFGQRHHKKSNPMRNTIIGTGIGLMTVGGLASCDKGLIEAESSSYANTHAAAWAYAPRDKKPIIEYDTIYVHDTITNTVRDTIIRTIIKPIIVREFPPNLVDSLIHQGLNIGAELDGPMPDENVLMVGARYYNEYDYKLYEPQLDSINTNSEQLSYVTKVTDMYDPDEPKTYFLSTRIVDDPGVGIKFRRYILPADKVKQYDKDNYPKASDPRFQYLESETRTNGNIITRDASGKIIDRKYTGKNTAYIEDRIGLPHEKKVEYLKGMNPGEFLFGQYVYDEYGNPYYDEDGNQEKAVYDFSNAKMWSKEVERIDPNTYYMGQ